MPRTVCPLDYDQFRLAAQSFQVGLDGNPTDVMAHPIKFGTGSFGWKLEGKVIIQVGGEDVECSFNGNIVCRGSRP